MIYGLLMKEAVHTVPKIFCVLFSHLLPLTITGSEELLMVVDRTYNQKDLLIVKTVLPF